MRLAGAAALTLIVYTLRSCSAFGAGVPPPAHETQIIIFRPSLPSRATVQLSGRCWTESIAVNRSGAWRCMHKNAIYDPCFEIAGRHGQVICGANPVKYENGFALTLTQPLPPRPRLKAVPQPWLVELTDDSICEAATGTMAVIDGEPVRYPCSSSPPEESPKRRVYCGLLDTLHRGSLWRADKVCFTISPSDHGPPFKLLNRKMVVIRRLWE
jgi:hypothetical protein